MKIKVIEKSYDEVINLARDKHKVPKRPNMFFRALMRMIASGDLKKTNFKFEKIGMDRLGANEGALILMNHSSFIDFEIIARILYPRPFNIVTTSDAFLGKRWLLRQIGCIPTKKFVNEPSLLKDIKYAIEKLRSSVILFPEAGYSFDGCSTTIPETIGAFAKLLGAPLVMINTYGAFSRDPLYNNLQIRNVEVSAKMEYILSPQELSEMSIEEVNRIIFKKFSFDNFRWQQENKVIINESTRADYLNRVLYKCPVCEKEGDMIGKGTRIICKACGKTHELTENGLLEAEDGDSSFTHIPDWFAWERKKVREELLSGSYLTDTPVEIYMTVNTKNLYKVGEGNLRHDINGFFLTGCGGKLNYTQKPLTSYTVNSDFNWYELGDIIGIGNREALYYCIPKCGKDIVAKTRLAAEEIYNLLMERKRVSKIAEN